MKTVSTLLLFLAFAINSYGVCTGYANVFSGSCDAYCNGQVEIGVSGGTAPYTLSVDGSYLATLQSDGGYQWWLACQGSHNYQFIDAAACTTSGSFFVYFRNPIPNSTITASGATTFCAPGSVTLNAAPGYFYEWYMNGSSIPGANSNTYVATTSGDYYCRLTDFIFCAVNSNIITVTVIAAAPTAAITAAGSTTFCSPGSVTLNANTGAGLSYQWRKDALNVSGGTSGSFVATGNGTYDCIVTNVCGSTTSNAIIVTVNSLPPAVITASGPTTFCSGGSVTFNASTDAGLSYEWRLNGQSISGATLNSYVATAGGDYDCVITNSCGTVTSNVISVTIMGLPPASITPDGPTTFCAGGSVTLNANIGPGLTYQWRKNSSTIAGATSTALFVTEGGSYDVLVTNACGLRSSGVVFVTIRIVPPAFITAGGPTSFCSSGSVTLTANNLVGGGVTYQWRLNGVNISGATTRIITFSAPGDYVCVVSTICGSTVSNLITVTVNSTPFSSITAGGSTILCSPGTVTLNANTGISYQWKLDGVNISGATESSFTAGTSGDYSCLVDNACGNATSNTISVAVYSGTTASITAGGPTTFCSPGSVTLSANTGTGLSYQWRSNGINISGATSDSFLANTGATYDCVVTNPCGSATSNSIGVTVNFVPAAAITAGGPTTFCAPGSVTLNANTGTGLTYQWRLNGGDISGATSNSFVASTAGNYDCTVTNLCGSSFSNVIAVSIITSPTATITANGPTTFCNGGSVLLSANTGTGLNYTWKNNGITISGATASTYSATIAGSYTATVANSCGTATSSPITVTIGGSAPAQPGTINGPGTFCSGQTGVVYSIAPVTDAITYVWLVSNGTITSGQNTTSITVTFGNKNGKIRVLASNSCGNSGWQIMNLHKNCREGGEAVLNLIPELSVFPNPTSSYFTLRISDTEQRVVLILRDMTGRELLKKDFPQGADRIEFGSDLPSGIYLAEIIYGENKELMRVIKE